MRLVAVLGSLALMTGVAYAEKQQCHVVDVEFTPAANLQIVVWLEDTQGTYLDTAFITQLTGTYGLGNRPGIKDFNSAWHWPYGRREYTFPVWAHRHGMSFPRVQFQNDDEYNLSHPFEQSSQETFFCRPLMEGEVQWDTQTCSSSVFTDKGLLNTGNTSLYPPRADLTMHQGIDDPAVATYNAMNPFDVISQATPIGGMDYTTSWPIPPGLAPGDYVMFVEVSKESDFNDTYNPTSYPPPTKPNGAPLDWSSYGKPARGQPSIVYRVPFTIGNDQTVATTSDYAGFGDAEGDTGTLHLPDTSITTNTPGSGASRLQLTADGQGGTFRVRVTARPEHDEIAPAAPQSAEVVAVDERSTTIDFTEPGDDGLIGPVKGFEVRYRAGTLITDANFFQSMPVPAGLIPRGPGKPQAVTVSGLLPQTHYYVGIRAYDECKNYGPLAVADLETTERQSGYVDACFVATAAYGSLLANDVEMLRRFRDQYLQSNVLGELAVETYYSVGPAVAGVVDQSEQLRGAARAALAPLVHFIGTMTARR
ncbi:MAG TPA: fibronectin type III domain-containing protein [Kofleriaceae bacterium]|nr:fibronectin type III domain-containing protein [Kofleriaceae bacterium]